MKSGAELRELARQIEKLCEASPCMSVAYPIVSNAVEHLCAIARIHEMNEDQNVSRA